MYGRTPERHFVRQTRSAIFWGMLVPVRRPRPGLADPRDQPRLAGRILSCCTAELAVTTQSSEAGRQRTPASTQPGSSWPSFPRRWGWSDTGSGGCPARRSPVIEYRGTVPSLRVRHRNRAGPKDHLRLQERPRTSGMKKAVQPIRVGFLGTGYIADWHAKALGTIPAVSLVAVCDKDESRARTFGRTLRCRPMLRVAGRDARGRRARPRRGPRPAPSRPSRSARHRR